MRSRQSPVAKEVYKFRSANGQIAEQAECLGQELACRVARSKSEPCLANPTVIDSMEHPDLDIRLKGELFPLRHLFKTVLGSDQECLGS